jgi:hypothetical protein
MEEERDPPCYFARLGSLAILRGSGWKLEKDQVS